jgi:glycosyltransferase involved in cell wall biosynthesis
MPKLSIITINLNNAAGLQKTVESVVSQTFADYEYIVIDGGSTDGSTDVIKRHEDRIAYWTSEPDSGIYSAMNKGIRQAKGEYCLFLNSGDWLSDNVLISVFDREHEEDILVGNAMHIDVNGNFLDRGVFNHKNTGEKKITLSDFLYPESGVILNHQSSFIRKKLFEKYGQYDENYRIISDWIFFLKVIGLHSADVKHFDITISHYNRDGISSQNIKLCNEERQKAIDAYVPSSILLDYQRYENTIEKLNKSLYWFQKSSPRKVFYRLAKRLLACVNKKINH